MKKLLKKIKNFPREISENIKLLGFWKGIRYSFSQPEWYYRLKCWFSPYNVIKIKTLPKTWQDRDSVLLHGAFQVLVDFVEKEWLDSPYHGKLLDIEEEKQIMRNNGYSEESINDHIFGWEDHNRVIVEVMSLYTWWTINRPLREANNPLEKVKFPKWNFTPTDETEEWFTLDQKFDNHEHEAEYEKSIANYHEWEEACHKEDEEMLIRLMKIRRCLWT